MTWYNPTLGSWQFWALAAGLVVVTAVLTEGSVAYSNRQHRRKLRRLRG